MTKQIGDVLQRQAVEDTNAKVILAKGRKTLGLGMVMAPQPSSVSKMTQANNTLHSLINIGSAAMGVAHQYNKAKAAEEEKQAKVDYMQGKLMYQQGLTAKQMTEAGMNKNTTAGWLAMRGTAQANDMYAKALNDIKNGPAKGMSPDAYRRQLQEQFKGMLTGDPNTDMLIGSLGEKFMGKLLHNQMLAHGEYQADQTEHAYRDMLIARGHSGDDLTEALDPNNPLIQGLSPERRQRALSDAIIQGYKTGDDTLGKMILEGQRPTIKQQAFTGQGGQATAIPNAVEGQNQAQFIPNASGDFQVSRAGATSIPNAKEGEGQAQAIPGTSGKFQLQPLGNNSQGVAPMTSIPGYSAAGLTPTGTPGMNNGDITALVASMHANDIPEGMLYDADTPLGKAVSHALFKVKKFTDRIEGPEFDQLLNAIANFQSTGNPVHISARSIHMKLSTKPSDSMPKKGKGKGADAEKGGVSAEKLNDPKWTPKTDKEKAAYKKHFGHRYYGKREDGTNKGSGWLGELPTNKKGVIMGEKSIGVDQHNIDPSLPEGKDMLIPSIVPGLTKAEIQKLGDGEMPKSVVKKAVKHARSQRKSGQSVWAPEKVYEGAEVAKNVMQNMSPDELKALRSGKVSSATRERVGNYMQSHSVNGLRLPSLRGFTTGQISGMLNARKRFMSQKVEKFNDTLESTLHKLELKVRSGQLTGDQGIEELHKLQQRYEIPEKRFKQLAGTMYSSDTMAWTRRQQQIEQQAKQAEKDARAAERMGMAISTNSFYSLTSKEQAGAWKLYDQQLMQEVQHKVQNGMSQEDAHQWYMQQRIQKMATAGVVDKATAHQWNATLSGQIVGKDGKVSESAENCYLAYRQLEQLNPKIAQSYLSNPRTRAIVDMASQLDDANMDPQAALIQAQIAYDRGETMASNKQFIRGSQAAITTEVDQAIHDLQPSFLTDVFGGNETTTSGVLDREVKSAIQSPEFRNTIDKRVAALKLKQPGLDDKTAARLAVKDAMRNSSFVMGSMIVTDSDTDLNTDMGLVSRGSNGELGGIRSAMAPHEATLLYLQNHGAEMWKGEKHGSQEGFVDWKLFSPSTWGEGVRGVPHMYVQYDKMSKTFLVAPLYKNGEMGAMHRIPAQRIGNEYKAYKLQEIGAMGRRIDETTGYFGGN